MPDVHNRSRYQAGCRCDDCKAAQSRYRADLNARRAAGKLGPKPGAPTPRKRQTTTDDTAPAPTSMPGGSVTAAVNMELEAYVGTEKRPALAAMALVLARVLDTKSALAQHATATVKLKDLLDEIAKYGVKKTNKLGAMRESLQSISGGKSA